MTPIGSVLSSYLNLPLKQTDGPLPSMLNREAMIEAALVNGDYAPFHEMTRALSTPFAEGAEALPYADPPPPDQRVYQTFCGT